MSRHSHLQPLTLSAIAALLVMTGCQALVTDVTNQIDGTAAALKEPDLPNTSRMLNCCNNLMSKSGTKGLVQSVCEPTSPQVVKVLNTYQSAKAGISGNANLSAQSKAESLAKLKTDSQATLEPAARCLLSETVGKLGNALIPKDCEVITSTGALPAGKQCSDVTSSITDAK